MAAKKVSQLSKLHTAKLLITLSMSISSKYTIEKEILIHLSQPTESRSCIMCVDYPTHLI